MAARADDTSPRPRPRPAPPLTGTGPSATAREKPADTPPASSSSQANRGRRGRSGRRSNSRALAVQQQAQSQQVVAAAGNAVVVAARASRLLGRTGWRLAKQIPIVNSVETQAQRLGHAVGAEFGRLLDVPQSMFAGATPEEQRAVTLIHNSANDPEPLRSAMTELLERSAERDGTRSRDYLYGTIVSQLVPDEARILAALAGGRRFAALDIINKSVGRNPGRVELANASTVGLAAKVSLPQNTGTYLTRLHGYGLIEFGAPDDELDSQFDALHEDPAVQRARASAEGRGRTVRKSVALSSLGVEFWAACAPPPGGAIRRST